MRGSVPVNVIVCSAQVGRSPLGNRAPRSDDVLAVHTTARERTMGDRSDTRTLQARDEAAAPVDEDLEDVLEDALDEAAGPRRRANSRKHSRRRWAKKQKNPSRVRLRRRSKPSSRMKTSPRSTKKRWPRCYCGAPVSFPSVGRKADTTPAPREAGRVYETNETADFARTNRPSDVSWRPEACAPTQCNSASARYFWASALEP